MDNSVLCETLHVKDPGMYSGYLLLLNDLFAL